MKEEEWIYTPQKQEEEEKETSRRGGSVGVMEQVKNNELHDTCMKMFYENPPIYMPDKNYLKMYYACLLQMHRRKFQSTYRKHQ